MIRKAREIKADEGPGYYFDSDETRLGYYGATSGKEPGPWMGRGSRVLGIEGEAVTEEAVRLLFDGIHPVTGEWLSESGLKICAYDITVSAPKSVSLAMVSPELRETVEEAHRAGAEVAVAYLEAACAFVRRRSGGEQHRLPADLVVAPFLHRVSRSEDPQLHTHLLFFALGHHDGAWSAIWSKPLQRLRTAGLLYQAEMRSQLARRGFAWGPVVSGAAELEGVPAQLLALFSKRRREAKQIAVGGTSRAMDAAVLATRPASPVCRQLEELVGRWRDEAQRAGYGIDEIFGAVSGEQKNFDGEQVLKALLGPDGLTATQTTVTFEDLIEAVAASCPTLDAGGVLMAASHLATHPDLRPSLKEGRLTTTELLKVEAELKELAVQPYAGRSVLSKGRAEKALVGCNLDDEMKGAAIRLLTSPKLVSVLTGPAGSAKTTVIATCAPIWRGRGTYPHAATIAALLADTLKRYHGIESSTVASLLYGRRRLPSGAVLIVEEASMVGSRQLLQLISLAHEAGGRVVLVGDSGQLPEIEAAGGGFADLAASPDAIQLRCVVRQRDEAEREQLSRLRTGQYAGCIDWLDRHHRLRGPMDSEEAIEQLANAYVKRVRADGSFGDTLLIARTWGLLHQLNRRVRELLQDETGDGTPLLAGPTIWVAGHRLAVQGGDRLLCRRNDYGAKLLNGMVGTVVSVDAQRGVELRLDDGVVVHVPRSYLDADDDDGHPLVAHAYATTAHRAQGMTAERALVLVTGEEAREWAYVALSRARGMTTAWVLRSPQEPAERAVDILARVCGRSDAQELASANVLPTSILEPMDADEAWDEADQLSELIDRDRNEVIANAVEALRDGPDAISGIRLALAVEGWRRSDTTVLPRWKAVMARLADQDVDRFESSMEDWLAIWDPLLSAPISETANKPTGVAVSLGPSVPASPSALPVLAPPVPADGPYELELVPLDFGDEHAA